MKATSSASKVDTRTKESNDDTKINVTSEKKKQRKDVNMVYELSQSKDKDDFEVYTSDHQKKKKNQ